MTRGQRLLTQALEDVRAIEARDPRVREIYGALCHRIPLLVLKHGLCQTVAYLVAKAGRGEKPEEQAHDIALTSLARTLELPKDDLLSRVQGAGLAEYLRQTRLVLAAAIYYKRFAVSVLGVEAAQDDDR